MREHYRRTVFRFDQGESFQECEYPMGWQPTGGRFIVLPGVEVHHIVGDHSGTIRLRKPGGTRRGQMYLSGEALGVGGHMLGLITPKGHGLTPGFGSPQSCVRFARYR